MATSREGVHVRVTLVIFHVRKCMCVWVSTSYVTERNNPHLRANFAGALGLPVAGKESRRARVKQREREREEKNIRANIYQCQTDHVYVWS